MYCKALLCTPNLILHQQAWYLAVTEVIAEFPRNQQQRWLNAASTLRMPYWDWAMDPGQGQPTVPTFVRSARITVTKPQGRVEIANPLYSYSWGNSMPAEMGGGPWNSYPVTLRRPVSNPTRSNNNEMNARFDNMRVSLRDRLFALFSSKQSWGFASTSQIGVRTDLSGSGTDSFESVHDSIHNTAGGESGGHMYYLDMSAFDPIFWLHHTNIDRLLNMYQYIVPTTYVANGNIPRPMAQWNEGEPKNSYTPLKPFAKNAKGDYYTSEDVRDTRVFGYYYPETSDRSYQQVAQAVSRLYGAGVRQLTKKRGLIEDVVGDATNVVGDVVDTVNGLLGGVTGTVGGAVGSATDKVGDVVGAAGDVVDGVTDTVGDVLDGVNEVVDDLVNGIGQFLGRPLKEGDYYHVLDITADKFAMDGSYTVHCFIGNGNGNGTSNSTAPYGNSTAPAYKPQSTGSAYPAKPNGTNGEDLEDYDPSKDFTNDPNYVGAYGILGGMKAGGGNASYPLITRGSLPLTTCLQGKEHFGYLKSLKPEHVEPYLAANMYYKVVGQNGEIDPSTIPNFHVAAKCTKVIPASSPDSLPDLSAPYEILHKATAKLPAGLPFVYKISPIDFVAPTASYEEDGKYNVGYPPNDNGGNYQSPSLGDGIFGEPQVPWSASGYCPVVKTIKYVYPDGKEAHY
jgi:tyrosinase